MMCKPELQLSQLSRAETIKSNRVKNHNLGIWQSHQFLILVSKEGTFLEASQYF